jgi:hypothetical protein
MTRWLPGGVRVTADGGFGRMRELDEPWAQGFGPCICPGPFDRITTGTAR